MRYKNTKILLVSPPKGVSLKKIHCPKFQTHPIGLLYLAAVLEKFGYPVRVLDALSFGISLSQIKNEIFEFKPDIVGISAMTISAMDAYSVAKIIKEIDTDIFTVMGGPHASALPEEVIGSGGIDIAVIGEGEYIMRDICEAVETKNNNFSAIGDIAYKQNDGGITRTKVRLKIQNLDDLPFPAYNLLPSIQDYNPPPHWGKKGAFASIITSRGCPYGCQFCSVTRVWGKKYRFRSVNNVLDELELLYRKYNVTHISFRDSVFTLLKRRVIEICKAIVERKLDIIWNCNGRANEVDEEMLLWMKKAGCKAIQYGIESGNEEILSVFKRLKKDTIRKTIEMTNKVGIEPHGYFMFGLPGETRATIRETIDFAISLNLYSAGFTTVTPFPGSELWDYCIENNLILTTDWSKYDLKGLPVSKHLNLTAEEILKAQKTAFRKFYLRPKIILKLLKQIESFNDILNYFFEALINLTRKKPNKKAH